MFQNVTLYGGCKRFVGKSTRFLGKLMKHGEFIYRAPGGGTTGSCYKYRYVPYSVFHKSVTIPALPD
jgi:hypothetical protein